MKNKEHKKYLLLIHVMENLENSNQQFGKFSLSNEKNNRASTHTNSSSATSFCVSRFFLLSSVII